MYPKKIHSFGWKPQLPDHRDIKYSLHKMREEAPKVLPKSVDLRPGMPPIYDQGQSSSCTSHAIAAALQYDMIKQRAQDFTPSRLFIYYNERDMEGDVDQDGGAEIRDGIKAVNTVGYIPENLWPFDLKNILSRPPEPLYKVAKNHHSISYFGVDNTNMNEVKSCLASGYPIVFGFSVYESYYDADNNYGHVVMPKQYGDRMLGGHAVLCCGYNDDTGYFVIRNSWGVGAGDKGYYYHPYSYFTNPNLTSDCWTIRSIV